MPEVLENILIFVGGAMVGSSCLAFWQLFFTAIKEKEESSRLSKLENEDIKTPEHIDTKV
jgi:hypothetical protein